MKICFICNEYPPGPIGGIGTVVQNIARGLIDHGHEVKVIGVYDANAYVSPTFENDHGVEVYRIKTDISNTFRLLKSWNEIHNQLKKWFKKGEIELIEMPDSYAWFSIFQKLKIPYLIRLHGSNTFINKILGYPIKKTTRFLESKHIQKADVLCSVSQFTAVMTKEIYSINSKIHIIYNGIDVSIIDAKTQVKPIKFDKKTVVFSGTIEHRKGVYTLVEAAISLLSKGKDILFIFNGKDSISKNTGASVISELLEIIPTAFHPNFQFNGHQSLETLIKYYVSCDIAAFPSLAETFGLTPIEAMLCEIPTIFSEYCAGPEIIDNWIDGVLIDPLKPNELSNAISKLLENKDISLQIAKNGRLKVLRDFSKETMVEKSILLYEESIENFKNKK